MKYILILLSLFSVNLIHTMQLSLPSLAQSHDEPFHITTQSTGSIDDHYRTNAILKQKDTILGKIYYIIYTHKYSHDAYFQAAIYETSLTDEGNFCERRSNSSQHLPHILLAYAIKDLISLQRQQKKPDFAKQQPFLIKSNICSDFLLLKEFGFEKVSDFSNQFAFSKLSVSLESESKTLALCDRYLARVLPQLSPQKDSSTSEEKEEVKIPKSKTRKTRQVAALSRLRPHVNGKERSAYQAMLAKTGQKHFKGISKKTNI